MATRFIALATVVIFVFVALFGLSLLLSHSGHHAGCPLMAAEEVMCESTIFEHVSIWQALFVSIVNTLLTLILTVFVSWKIETPKLEFEHVRLRCISRAPRPTLLQELYAQGILNRKEPYCFVAC